MPSTPTVSEAASPANQAGQAAAPGLMRVNSRRIAGAVAALALLVAVLVASLLLGSREVNPMIIIEALTGRGSTPDHAAIIDFRAPRTLAGLLVGIALGISGALIQALTRNPLADPGILGVNSGAAFAVVMGVAFFGAREMGEFVFYSFAGALMAVSVVYFLGSRGRSGGTPIKLTLAGIAFGAVLSGITQGFILLDESTFNAMRFWGAGSLAATPVGALGWLSGCVAAGLAIALLISRSLNATALGDDHAATMGASLGRTRVLVVIAVTLLCGAATAAAGPIGFIGLMVPHIARWITGPDQRWIMLYTILLAPSLLVGADIAGRLIIRPDELQVGIVTAFIGAPVLIWLVRRKSASTL
ncbi:iron chelate uptake ABC transporter family permease subunit [Paeniglutamicibacter sp. NPDC091659]|uniref:iron chelate uptake ABC transporter family permease subunit n=1 Tax=Paeniglutamicibacter sp. NPDC091659 TaxID=3364389 RepID=UPI0038292AC4